MTIPPVLVEVREPRRYAGWILFALLIVLTSGFASVYYTMVGSKGYKEVQKVDRALREAVLSNKALQPARWKLFDRQLEKIKTLEPRRYAAIRLVSTYERTKEINAQDIETLKKSSNPTHKWIAEIYTQPHSGAELSELDNKINKNLFVGVLATIHLYERNGDHNYRSAHMPKESTGTEGKWVEVIVYGGATVFGLMLLVLYAAFRSSGFLKPLGHPLAFISVFDADCLAMRAAQILAVTVAVGLMPFLAGVLSPELLAIVQSGVMIGLVLLLTASPIWGKRFTLANLGITRKNLLANIGWGIGGYFANIPILIFVTIFSRKLFFFLPDVSHPVVSEIKNASNGLMVAAVFVSVSLQAPIVEEILFRGSLLPALARVMKSPVLAIVISSLIFASTHTTGLPSWLPLATIGAMAAALTYQTRSLLPAMVLHAVHNGSMMLMTMYSGS